MPKPKSQPLEVVRRGMSSLSPMKGLRSLSPATKAKKNKSSRKQQKHVVEDDHDDGYYHNDYHRTNSRDEQRDNIGSSSRGHTHSREQPASSHDKHHGRRNTRGSSVMDHLAELSIDDPHNGYELRPPTPLDMMDTRGGKSKANSKKKHHPRQQEHREDRYESRHHHPTNNTDAASSSYESSHSTAMSRSQLIENPQMASSSMSSSATPLYLQDTSPPPPPPSQPRPHKSRGNFSKRQESPQPHQRNHQQPKEMVVMSVQEEEELWRTRKNGTVLQINAQHWGSAIDIETMESADSFRANDAFDNDEDEVKEEEGHVVWRSPRSKADKSSNNNKQQHEEEEASSPTRQYDDIMDASAFLFDSREQDILYNTTTATSSKTQISSPKHPHHKQNSSHPPKPPPPPKDTIDNHHLTDINGGKGFLKQIFGGKQQKTSGISTERNALAAELLEIGSDATLTAGDLLIEDSLSSPMIMSRDDSFPTTKSSAIDYTKGRGVFFPDDSESTNIHSSSLAQQDMKSERESTAEITPIPITTKKTASKEKKELTGDYLQSKFMQLESSNNDFLSGFDKKDMGDYNTNVSNLTEPDFATSSAKPSLDSWVDSAPHTGEAALGRALDMQFMPSTSETADDLMLVIDATGSSSHRPPLLPNKTTSTTFSTSPATPDASSAQAHENQRASLSSSPLVRRRRARSRTPSPSAAKRAVAQSRRAMATKSRTPSPASRVLPRDEVKVSSPRAERHAPLKERVEVAKPVYTKKQGTLKSSDWSKAKDNLIETRVAESRNRTSNQQVRSISSSPSKKISSSLAPKDKQSPGRAQSASRVRRGTTTRAQALSITRHSSRPKSLTRQGSPQPDKTERARGYTSPSASRQTSPRSSSKPSAPSKGARNKMEPLSQVMSRVPSSLGSRGGASDSIELARRNSAMKRDDISNKVQTTPVKERGKPKQTIKQRISSTSSRGRDSIELKRRATSPSRKRETSQKNNPLNSSRPLSASQSKQRTQNSGRPSSSSPFRSRQVHAKSSRPSSASRSKQVATSNRPYSAPRSRQTTSTNNTRGATKKISTGTSKTFQGREVIPVSKVDGNSSPSNALVLANEKTRSFPTNFSQLKKMRALARAPLKQPKPSYVPANVYAGRFTPKKKKDRLTELLSTKNHLDHEHDEQYSTSVGSGSPRRRYASRETGAQKLKRMLLLNSVAGEYAEGAVASLRSYRQSAGVRNRKQAPQSNDRMTMIREHGLIDSFSVDSSNLRSLRSAIGSRSSHQEQPPQYWSDSSNSMFDHYDETKIVDPMQKAGLRLLHASVVPIQSTARRYLARKEALTMLWGALVIQAHIRGFLEKARYEIKVYAIIRIQSAVRGMLARDRLMFEDYCATEIQRHVRGYLAALRVYDTVYNISLVQSQVRMKLAIKHAANRLYCVLKIQGAARGFLVRCRLLDANARAIDIQRCVRGYLATMRVFEEIYYITIVQNQVRKKQAIEKATKRMTLILSLQGLVRGFLVRCRLEHARYHATTLQRYVRGFLGTMHVYEEIYKIMLIQNFVRMRIATNLATKRMSFIIKLQANWRRHCVLRRMDYARYNVLIIQRYVRGYLATIRVYEDIYKITLIQNFVRMKVAQQVADRRMVAVWKLQATARGFILRGRLRKIQGKAVTIQSSWRAFYYRLVYQFKLLDIIIVQSVWRRRQACRLSNQLRHALQVRSAVIIQARWRCYDAHETYLQYKIEDRAAKIIQTQWRCYDTSMDYLHYLADVLIVQSVIRRWFAMREVTAILVRKSIVLQRIARGFLGRLEYKRVKAAVTIQKTWRGFVCFADYMFRIADIVIVQTLVRRWLAKKRVLYLKHKIEHDAATVIQRWRRKELNRRNCAAVTIQKVWRGVVQEAEFVIALYEYRAVRTIQAYWRRFWKFSNYLICLDCSIRIQAAVRGFLARCRYADEQWGAVILQAAVRGIISRRRVMSQKLLTAQVLTSNAIGSLQSMAATITQATVRTFLARNAYLKFIAARRLQATFRGYLDRVVYREHEASRQIQAIWRGFSARKFCIETIAAILIQRYWRGYAAQQYRAQIISAMFIQQSWREFKQSLDYKRAVAAIAIQKYSRKLIYTSAYKRFLATRCIQNCWRALYARQALRLLQIQAFAATEIQSAWRGYLQYTNYLFALCDIVRVQSIVRRRLALKEMQRVRNTQENCAAMTIQRIWRGFYSYTCFLITLAEVIRIQSVARQFLARKHYLSLHHVIKIQRFARFVLAKTALERLADKKKDRAAIVLQRTWRRYFCESNYSFIISDIVKAQTALRRYLAVKKFLSMWESHATEAAVKIQTQWRCFFASSNYIFVRDDIIRMQALVRGFLARQHFVRMFVAQCQESATLIQSSWRRHRDKRTLAGMLTSVYIIQRSVRNFFQRKEQEAQAALLIQSTWRGFSCYAEYCMMIADIIRVQCLARGFKARNQYRQLCFVRQNICATKIQATFRGWLVYKAFLHKRRAVLDIQRYWRGYNGRVVLFIAWKQHVIRIHKSATEIQKHWRGYLALQRYLYKLGSVIELQSLARMIYVQAECRKRQEAALKIQSARRQFLARRVMLVLLSFKNMQLSKRYGIMLTKATRRIQRRWRNILRSREQEIQAFVIQDFIRQAAARRQLQKRIAARKICTFWVQQRKRLSPEELLELEMHRRATTIQRWYPFARRLRALRHVRACRIIVKFLKTVKAEVDLEVQLEMQRRKERKEMKRREKKKEDEILEIAWEHTSSTGLDTYRRRRGSTITDGDRKLQEALDEMQSRSRCNMYAPSISKSNQRGGVGSEGNSSGPPMIALADELEDYTLAPSSMMSAALRSPTPSRVESFSQQDFDEDYCLEEAFLDAEIHSAKSRRRSEKKQKSRASRHRHSRSSNGSITSAPSVGSRSSRVSINSRLSLDDSRMMMRPSMSSSAAGARDPYYRHPTGSPNKKYHHYYKR